MKITWENTDSKVLDAGGSSIESTQGVLEIHGLMNFSVKLSNEPTTHPVEEGEPIQDHILRLPYEIVCECIISQTPTKEIQGLTSIQKVDLGSFVPRSLKKGASGEKAAEWNEDQETFGAKVIIAEEEIDFVQDAFETINWLKDNAVIVNLEDTPRGRFEDVVLTTFEDSVNREIGQDMMFTISFVHQTTVTLTTIDAPEPAVERARRAQEESSEEGEEVDEETANQPERSWAHQLGDVIGNLPDIL